MFGCHGGCAPSVGIKIDGGLTNPYSDVLGGGGRRFAQWFHECRSPIGGLSILRSPPYILLSSDFFEMNLKTLLIQWTDKVLKFQPLN
jgi:hypothetical protein